MDLLMAAVIVLVVMWFLGLTFFGTLGSLIHLLLVIAIVIIAIRLIRGEKI